MTNSEIILKFKEEYNKELQYIDERFICNGDLTIMYKDEVWLPNNLTINGCLTIKLCRLVFLPDNLYVSDDICIESCENLLIGNHTTFNGVTTISYCYITSLPTDLKLKGCVNLSFLPLRVLPDWTEINGSLSIDNVSIEDLPQNLIIKGCLIIKDRTLNKLPENLVVYNTIDLSKSNISEIQNGLICRNITLPNNRIRFPEEFIAIDSLKGTPESLRDLSLLKYPTRKLIVDKPWLFKPKHKSQYEYFSRENRELWVLKDLGAIWKINGKEYFSNGYDSFFGEIIEQSDKLFKIRHFYNNKEYIVITDEKDNWGRGVTMEDAKSNLNQVRKRRYVHDYKYYTQAKRLSISDISECFQNITGLSSTETFNTLYKVLPKPIQDTYTIGDIIDYTSDEHCALKFTEYFKNKNE
jgi:hypothetical protein